MQFNYWFKCLILKIQDRKDRQKSRFLKKKTKMKQREQQNLVYKVCSFAYMKQFDIQLNDHILKFHTASQTHLYIQNIITTNFKR